jgi:DNA-3-methyladenine glycosylase I
MSLQRCRWCSDDPLYIDYHDQEWGKPLYDEAQLFELLCLEGQQAGLSWITVLKKRDCYRQHFFSIQSRRLLNSPIPTWNKNCKMQV